MSLYLLAEAGSLLSAGATLSVFSGSDASPAFMPTLPWLLPTRNTPPYLATPPIGTRIAPGTPRPPTPYRNMYLGEGPTSGRGDDAGSLDDDAGAMDPSAEAGLRAGYQAAVANAQAHGVPIPEPPPDLYAIMSPAERAAASQAAQSSYFRGQSPGTGTYTMPLRTVAPAPAPAPSDTPLTMTTPPILFGRPAPSSPPTFDTATAPSGGGGGGAAPTPWGAIAAAGAVLALIYFGRKKRR